MKLTSLLCISFLLLLFSSIEARSSKRRKVLQHETTNPPAPQTSTTTASTPEKLQIARDPKREEEIMEKIERDNLLKTSNSFSFFVFGFLSSFSKKIKFDTSIDIYREIISQEGCSEMNLKKLYEEGTRNYDRYLEHYKNEIEVLQKDSFHNLKPSEIITQCLYLKKEKENEIEKQKKEHKSNLKMLREVKKMLDQAKNEKIKIINKQYKLIKNNGAQEKIDQYDREISRIDTKIVELTNTVYRYNEITDEVKYQMLIEDLKIETQINCKDFVNDNNKGFALSLVSKVLNLPTFFKKVIECGSKPEIIRDSAKEFKQYSVSFITEGSKLVNTVKEKKVFDFIKQVLSKGFQAAMNLVKILFNLSRANIFNILRGQKGKKYLLFYRGRALGFAYKLILFLSKENRRRFL